MTPSIDAVTSDRKRRVLRGQRVAMLLFAVYVSAPAAFAYDCISIPVKSRYRTATLVFVGSVRSTSTKRTARLIDHTATIEVSQWFAGHRRKVITLHLDSYGGLLVGHEYLFFTRCENGRLVNSGCSTRPLDQQAGKDDLRRLRRHLVFWRFQRALWRRWHRVKSPKCSAD